MAQYNMIKEIKEIQKLTGKTFEELTEEFEGMHWGDDEFIVSNRSKQNAVLAMLSEVKTEKKRAEIREERLATFHWTKENGTWVVAGNFENLQKGDTVKILKASGERITREIVRFTEQGNAEVK